MGVFQERIPIAAEARLSLPTISNTMTVEQSILLSDSSTTVQACVLDQARNSPPEKFSFGRAFLSACLVHYSEEAKCKRAVEDYGKVEKSTPENAAWLVAFHSREFLLKFIGATASLRIEEKDLEPLHTLAQSYPGLFESLLENNLLEDFFAHPELFFQLRYQNWDLCIETYHHLKRSGALQQCTKLEQIWQSFGAPFWGVAYQLGAKIFELSPEESKLIEYCSVTYGEGIGTAFAFIPRERWLDPIFLELCDKYPAPGYEYLGRSNSFADLTDPDIERLEQDLTLNFGIKHFHRYLETSAIGYEKWSFLEPMLENFRDKDFRNPSARPTHVALFQGLERTTPDVYPKYMRMFKKMMPNSDIFIAEVENRDEIKRIRDNFRRKGCAHAHTISYHFHGSTEKVFLSDDSGKCLRLIDTEPLQEFFTWPMPGGQAIIEVCHGAVGYPRRRSLLTEAVRINPSVRWTAFNDGGALEDMYLDAGTLVAVHSEPKATVIVQDGKIVN